MNNGHKVDSLLNIAVEAVFATLSTNAPVARQLARSLSFDDIEPFICNDLTQLKRNLAAFGGSDVFRFIHLAQLADDELEAEEVIAAHDIVQACLPRMLFLNPGYKSFLGSTDPVQSAQAVMFWMSDTGPLGFKDSRISNVLLLRLAFLASTIAKSSEIFDAYSVVASIVARLIVSSGGINAEEQAFLGAVEKMLAGYREAITNHSADVMAELGTTASASPATTPHIVDAVHITPADAMREAVDELTQLVGVTGVKAEVGKLSNFLKIRQQRIAAGMPATSQSLHFVFTGNPGTGKTTVARIVSKILYGFGILKSPTLTETDRSSLVGGFLGQTAIKTAEVIAKANNGVLFIDEAYTLAPISQQGDQYGQEAIDTLLKRMEDLRDTLVVIVAGYPKRMSEFLASNPGLESRFTRFIHFDDYTVSDMCQIFDGMCLRNSYSLTPAARANLAVVLDVAHTKRDDRFGNARFVRNLFEKTLGKHSDRLAAFDGEITRQMLATVEAEDIPFEMLGGTGPINLSETKWRVRCPGCRKLFTVDIRFLGNRANCKCGIKFICPWWNPDPDSLPAGLSFKASDREEDLNGLPVPAQADPSVTSPGLQSRAVDRVAGSVDCSAIANDIPKDPHGWENVRFGMTETDVAGVLSGKVSAVNPPVRYSKCYAPLRIIDKQMHGQLFDVDFQFNCETQLLEIVMMTYKSEVNRVAFDTTVKNMSSAYGHPSAVEERASGANAEWRFATTRIRAMLSDIPHIGPMLKVGYYSVSNPE